MSTGNPGEWCGPTSELSSKQLSALLPRARRGNTTRQPVSDQTPVSGELDTGDIDIPLDIEAIAIESPVLARGSEPGIVRYPLAPADRTVWWLLALGVLLCAAGAAFVLIA